jgi:hyperosmotically inducible protein
VIRRLLSLIIVVGLVVLVLYYWKYRPSARPIGSTDLGEVGRKVREEVGDVGQKLRDTKTTGTVKAALELNRTVQPYDIEVSTDNGVVTLRGGVPDATVSNQAERVASAVPDVRQVVNHLRVGEAPPHTSGGADRTLGENVDDQKLEMQVRLAFSLNRELKGTDIGVKSFRRQVTLSGRVGSEAQRRIATQIAGQIPDAAGVVDQIQVGDTAAATAATGPGTDGGGRAAAEKALAANANLARYALRVSDDGGRLVVTGTVRTSAEKDLAALVAGQAAGSPVENAVQVKP